MYKALVESILNYGITIYGQASRYLIQKLQHTQNRVIRHFRQRVGGEERYSINAEILNIKQLFIKRIVINYRCEMQAWERVNHVQTTRAKTRGSFKIGSFANKYGERSKCVRVKRIFNQIPQDILNIQCQATFKREIDKWIRDNRCLVDNM